MEGVCGLKLPSCKECGWLFEAKSEHGYLRLFCEVCETLGEPLADKVCCVVGTGDAYTPCGPDMNAFMRQSSIEASRVSIARARLKLSRSNAPGIDDPLSIFGASGSHISNAAV